MNTTHQLAIAFQAAPVPILAVDTGGVIVEANEALNELFEYGEGELIGQKVEVLVPENLRAGHVELRDAYMELPCRRQLGETGEVFGMTKLGRLIPVEIGLNFVEADGRRLVIASVVNVSAKKNEELQYRLALDSAASAMLMIEPDGTIVFANKTACEIFGYDLFDMVGLNVEMLVPERVRRKHSVYRKSFMTSPTSRSMGAGRELFGVRRDGSEFPLEIGLTPIRNDGASLIMATVIDISQRRSAESQNEASAA